MHELHRGRLAAELLEGLRAEFGFNSPVAWSVGMETELADAFPPEWYEQETIRGDFLRAIDQLRMNPEESLDIESYLSESHRAGTLASAATNRRKHVAPASPRRSGPAGRRIARRRDGRNDECRRMNAECRLRLRKALPFTDHFSIPFYTSTVKIHALKIDGYGIWSGLRVERFSDGLNVLYGPNEAGKTTLLQFIRSMLYGFSDSRRQYFPPVHGGKPGGMADVDSPQGRYEIARHWQPENGGEQIILTASDGTRQGEHLVKAMLSDIDEAIFNNVFAVELREMQELGALGDTAAAELLYNLTAGLDRVSLVEVLRELEISRNRILDADGKPCLVANLQAEREKLRCGNRGTRRH